MIIWSLRTRLHDLGMVTITGKEEGDLLVFPHPEEDGEIVLRVAKERAIEIASWARSRQMRFNMQLERKEMHSGREFRDQHVPSVSKCPYCDSLVTIVGEDFVLHGIPWCEKWRAEQ